jgi:hypothetical protein
MLVRYHDAIPLLMPHTISDRYFHQTFHYQALRKNVESGAWFACVSDATRRDLLALFPQLEGRAITIHNMVSHHYFPEDSSQARLPEIIGTRRHSGVKWRSPQKAPLDAKGLESRAPEYLLIVSTIEPRKNHVNLLAAWEKLRVERFFHLKLVVVGALGWDHKPILRRFRPWIERDQLFVLDDVPAPELRLLYRYAQATVCPSFGEGFDFSGVEAMRCGGVVSASDIPVHREVYGEAAQYFNPYSPDEMADAIAGIIDPLQSDRREALVAQGAVVSARYLPERILPQWEKLLHSFRQTPQRACNAASPLAR